MINQPSRNPSKPPLIHQRNFHEFLEIERPFSLPPRTRCSLSTTFPLLGHPFSELIASFTFTGCGNQFASWTVGFWSFASDVAPRRPYKISYDNESFCRIWWLYLLPGRQNLRPQVTSYSATLSANYFATIVREVFHAFFLFGILWLITYKSL